MSKKATNNDDMLFLLQAVSYVREFDPSKRILPLIFEEEKIDSDEIE